MKTTSLRLFSLLIHRQHDVILCRRRARQIAAALGFGPREQTRIATAVSEISRNALDYGQGGEIDFEVETSGRPSRSRPTPVTQNLRVIVRDKGPGIPPADELARRPRLGHGLSGAARLMDELHIQSQPGATAVTMRRALPVGVPTVSHPQLQAMVDAIANEPATDFTSELQLQNQELLRALDELSLRQEDVARVNQELADTNAGVVALYDELETLHRVSSLLASQIEIKALLQAIIDATTDLTGAQIGAFFYKTEEQGAWVLYAAAGPAKQALDALPTTYEANFFGPTFGASSGEEETSPSNRCHPNLMRALGDPSLLASCLTIPVTNETTTLGALVFGSAEEGAFTERSERIVMSIAAQAAIGIQNAKLYERVRNSNAAKDRFLAMLSHELRTPLNPVLAVVSSLVDDDRLPVDVQQDLQVVLRNTRLEARLIDDLLDFSRIINGKLQLHRESLDLHALIREVVSICREDVESRAQTVSLALDAAFSGVTGDSARLQQVLWNVLKNSVKFTPTRGHISIATRLPDEQTIEVEIADDGVGIEPLALGQIFGAFEQGGAETTAKFGGLGLGLAISRAFVELHGGTIRAQSAGVGQGAQIFVRLPLVRSENASMLPATAAPTSSVQSSTAATLLLVDDHMDTLNIMSKLLSRQGYRVVTASSCQEALATARQQPFDLIVSDLGLPDGSGLDLLPKLRQIRVTPAVALSGFGMEDDVKESQAAGYNDHLTKPIDFPLLVSTITRLVVADAEPRQPAKQEGAKLPKAST